MTIARLLRLCIVATLALALGLTGSHATSTLAANTVTLPGSTFESGDGNLVPNTAGNEDWNNSGIQCASGPPPVTQTANCGIDLASGTGDNSFGQGSKEDNACNTVVSGSIPPNKSDLTRFYVKHEKQNGKDFVYLAWERTNTLGNANMDFEFSQSNTACPNGVTPVKTAGDALVTYDFGGTGAPDIGLLRWETGTAPWNAACFASSSFPCWGGRVDLTTAGEANAGVNDPIFISTCNAKTNPAACTVHDSILGGDLPIDTFGEAGINLTDSGLFPPGACVNFGNTMLNSRSSSSFTSEIKDFIAPIPTSIDNCGTVVIKKHTDPRGINQSFSFTSNLTGAQVTCSQAAPSTATSFTLNDSGNTTADNAANTQTCTNVPFGSYHVTEGSDPSTFTFESLSCSTVGSGGSTGAQDGTVPKQADITLSGPDTVTCTYTNQQKLAPSLVTTPSTKVTSTSTAIAGVGTGTSTATGFNMTVPLNSSISDVATYSGTLGTVTGTVTFNLYHVAPGVDPTTACVAANQVTLPSTFANVSLSGGTAQSPYYDTSSHLGTYVWQDVYTPATGSNYITTTETCGDEQVHIMDARIQLTPGQATNAVGSPHTLTATLQTTLDGTTWTPVNNAGVSFAITNDTSTGASFVNNTNTCTTGTAGTCTVQITDAKTGIVTISATATGFTQTGLSVGTFTRATGDGVSSDSPNATKYYVDGKIGISPSSAINASGSAHTLTVTVQQNTGSGFAAVPDGQSVSLSFASNAAGATFTGGTSTATCLTSGGTCTATINTTGVGAVTVNASTTFSITPSGCTSGTAICTATFTRSTGDGVSGDSANAAKQYDNARISISPLAPENVVGNPETFTIQVQQATAQTGSGPTWTNVGAGVTVSYNIVIGSGTPSDASFVANNTAAGTCPPSAPVTGNPTPLTATTDSNGQIQVTVLSCLAGTIQVHASVGVHFARPTADPLYPADLVITRATGDSVNTALGGSADAVKTYLNPSTQLSVSDKLVGLDATAAGTVTYTIYASAADCANQTNGHADGGGTVTAGVVPSSTTVTVGPVGSDYTGTIYFRAQFTGTLGGANQSYLSPCTESASSS